MVDRLGQLTALVTPLAVNSVDNSARRSAKLLCKFVSETERRHHAGDETLVFPVLPQLQAR